MNVHCIYQLSGKKNLFLLSTRFAQWKWKLRIISNFQTMKAAMKSYNSRASYSYFCALIYLFKNFKFFSRDEMVYFWFDNYLVFIDSSVNYRILLFVDKTSWFVMLHCCFIYHFPPKKSCIIHVFQVRHKKGFWKDKVQLFWEGRKNLRNLPYGLAGRLQSENKKFEGWKIWKMCWRFWFLYTSGHAGCFIESFLAF